MARTKRNSVRRRDSSIEFWREHLASRFALDDEGRRHIDKSPEALDWAISGMKSLGLQTYEDRTLSELKRQREYMGRVYFRRLSEIRITNGSSICWAGQPNGSYPHGLTLHLELKSLDRQRRLIVNFGTTSWPDAIAIADGFRSVTLGPQFPFGYGALRIHRIGKPGNEDCDFSHGKGDEECRVRRLPDSEAQIRDAYRSTGTQGVFNELDRVWIELMTARPMPRPLGQVALRIRCRLHRSQFVQVHTPQGVVVATLIEPIYGNELEIQGVRITPLDDHTQTIASPDILELLPCRPEYNQPAS